MSGVLGVLSAVLAIAAAALALVCAIGVLAMRDGYQKLHYVSTPATLCAVLLAAAVALHGAGAEATLKAFLVAAVLSAANGVVGHATARAAFVRDHGHWPPRADEVRTPAGEGRGKR